MTAFEQAISFIEKELNPDIYYVIYDIFKDDPRDNTIFRGTTLNAELLRELFSNFDENDRKNYIVVPVTTDSHDMDFTQAIPFPDFMVS